jgi:hypothetical protein
MGFIDHKLCDMVQAPKGSKQTPRVAKGKFAWSYTVGDRMYRNGEELRRVN